MPKEQKSPGMYAIGAGSVMDAAVELLKLAQEKFGKLTPAEKKLFRASARGEMADYSPRSKKPIDPANAAKWGPSRVLLADRIAWLCTDKQAAQLVTHRGIRIEGSRIDEELDLEAAKVLFPLRFKQCKFTTHINLQQAQIVALYMPGTHTGPVSADGLKVKGSIFLRDGFKAEGKVRMPGATVGGSISCVNGQFINNGGKALVADRVKVAGSVFLRNGFRAEGSVSFVAATIYGRFSLSGIASPAQMELKLNSAEIGTLHDNEDSWPAPQHLVLHGLAYGEISRESPRDSERRIEWLRLQDGFWAQPYEQLAKVLRESGDGAGARDVLVAKNKDKAQRTKLTRAEWSWYRLFGPLIGYGHKPWLALPLALMIVLSGWVFFKEGYSHGLVTPLSELAYSKDNAGTRRVSEEYPVFNSFVYSIDVFIPVVDLHQVKYWLPNANRGSELVPTSSAALCTGGLLLFWLWIETALGWILTTLFLVGITGLVRT